MAKKKYWKLDIISIHQRKVKITLYKKAFLFHHIKRRQDNVEVYFSSRRELTRRDFDQDHDL